MLALPSTPAAHRVECDLSSAQLGLWFIEQLNGASALYHVPRAWRIDGPIDAERLQSALHELVARHPNLRCAFRAVDGLPRREVSQPSARSVHLERVDATAVFDDAQRLRDLLRQHAARPMDLGEAPLLRAWLLHGGGDRHVLLLVAHHIVFDGRSVEIAAEEIGRAYQAGAGADAGALTPPGSAALPSDAPGAQSHREWPWPSLEPALDHWTRQIGGLPELALPLDRRRPVEPDHRGATFEFDLPPDALPMLRALAREHDATVFGVLLAAFLVLMSRLSGQDDVAVGIPVSVRGPGEADTIGHLVNSVVIRADTAGAPAFHEFLVQVRDTLRAAIEHRHLPFEHLVSALRPERQASRNPLYQVSFARTRAVELLDGVPGVHTEPLFVDTGLSQLDLSFTVHEMKDGRLVGQVEYSSALLEAATVRRWADAYATLCAALLAAPATPIDRLPLLKAEERAALLALGNDTTRPRHGPQCLHQRFQAAARARPNAVAVRHDQLVMTYGELEHRAARLAAHLRRLGVGPEVCVGVCLPRSPELIVAVWAVLCAGGTYVPLDPSYPDARLFYKVRDSAVRVILAHERWRFESLPVQVIDTQVPERNLEPVEQATSVAAAEVDPDHLAYVLYTSGSTGTPKGVEVSHRAICNHAQWMAEALDLSARDVFLLKTSVSFDASLVEILLPGVLGAQCVLASDDGERDPHYLAAMVLRHGVTVLQSVPSALAALIDEPQLRECKALRRIISGGEALDRELAQRVHEAVPWVALGNFYGPTETTIDATWHEVGPLPPGAGSVPIGRPVANARCHILDRWREPVPIGVIGELHIGGVGLARGYLGLPERTAERFIDDPFHAGQRLYRTGDLARYRSDGSIEYVGRMDQQVKLRGFRIELGEIESLIQEVIEGRPCVAMLRRDARGAEQLVAYLEGDRTFAQVIRVRLSHLLPEHMVPAQVCGVASWPRLPSGKIDRKALPAPQWGTAEQEREAPANELEKALLSAWQETLGVSDIGVTDSFFDLGGHSLLATRLVRRIQAAVSMPCSLPLLYREPTVRGLAQALMQGTLPQGAEVVRLADSQATDKLFLLCGVHLYRPLAQALARDVACYGVFLPYEQIVLEQDDELAALPLVEAMAADYVRVLKAEQARGPYRLAGVSFGGILAFEAARQLHAAGERVESLCLIDSRLHGSVGRHWGRWLATQFSWRTWAQRVARVQEGLSGLRPQALAGAWALGDRSAASSGPRPTHDTDADALARRDRLYEQAIRAYKPQRYDGRALLVRATEHGLSDADHIHPTYLWSHSIRHLQVVDVAGDHLGLLRAPHVTALAEQMRAQLHSPEPQGEPALGTHQRARDRVRAGVKPTLSLALCALLQDAMSCLSTYGSIPLCL